MRTIKELAHEICVKGSLPAVKSLFLLSEKQQKEFTNFVKKTNSTQFGQTAKLVSWWAINHQDIFINSLSEEEYKKINKLLLENEDEDEDEDEEFSREYEYEREKGWFEEQEEHWAEEREAMVNHYKRLAGTEFLS